MVHEPLQWVSVQGEIHHVSEYHGLLPHERPEALCPVCGTNLVLKLGECRIDHAAHKPDIDCILTEPETVIHLNSKYHLWKELNRVQPLLFWQECAGWKRDAHQVPCLAHSRRPAVLIEDWDRAEVEWPVGNYWADVALLKANQVIGVIEVKVTHASEARKIEYLIEQAIPWVEIGVTRDFYSGDSPWKAEEPLPCEGLKHGGKVPWQCDPCKTSAAAYKRDQENFQLRQEQRQSRADYARQFKSRFIRLVDHYYPSGKHYRFIYIIQDRIIDNEIVYSELQEYKNKERRTISMEPAPIDSESHKRLVQALKNELDNQIKKYPNWVIDLSQPWLPAPERYHPNMFLDFTRWPLYFEFVNGAWNKIEQKKDSAPYRPHLRVADSAAPTGMDEALSFLHTAYRCECCGQMKTDWVSRNGKTQSCLCRDCANKDAERNDAT